MGQYDKDHKIYAGLYNTPRPSTESRPWSASITFFGRQPGSCNMLLSPCWAAEWT